MTDKLSTRVTLVYDGTVLDRWAIGSESNVLRDKIRRDRNFANKVLMYLYSLGYTSQSFGYEDDYDEIDPYDIYDLFMDEIWNEYQDNGDFLISVGGGIEVFTDTVEGVSDVNSSRKIRKKRPVTASEGTSRNTKSWMSKARDCGYSMGDLKYWFEVETGHDFERESDGRFFTKWVTKFLSDCDDVKSCDVMSSRRARRNVTCSDDHSYTTNVQKPELTNDPQYITEYVWANTDSKLLQKEFDYDNGSVLATDEAWWVERNNFSDRAFNLLKKEMKRLFPNLQLIF